MATSIIYLGGQELASYDSATAVTSLDSSVVVAQASTPTGTIAQRPGSPAVGYTRFNTTNSTLEFWDGTNWISTNLIPSITSISGDIINEESSALTIVVTNNTDTVDVLYYENSTLHATTSNVTVTTGSLTTTVPSTVYGQSVGDTINIKIKNSDGVLSSSVDQVIVEPTATGGVKTYYGIYTVHTFKSTNDFVLNIGIDIDILLVGGGGAGGYGYGAGGGSGGIVWVAGQTLLAGTYGCTVGDGGIGDQTEAVDTASRGNSSTFIQSSGTTISLTAGYGGAGGGPGAAGSNGLASTTSGVTYETEGGQGGTGGREAGNTGLYEGGDSGQFDGTTVGNQVGNDGASGGGARGVDGADQFPRGSGSNLSAVATKALLDAADIGETSGSSVYIAGTGGGSRSWAQTGTAGQTGGLGGGGGGSGNNNAPNAGANPQSEDGDPNTGGGGGGQVYNVYNGGSGGSGFGIIRYVT